MEWYFYVITIISKIFPITILIKYYSKAKSYQKINYFKLFENNNLILNDEKEI